MSESALRKSPSRGFAFGTSRSRRRVPTASGVPVKSEAEMIADFLREKDVTRCPTRYADGAIRPSGSYDW